ncbi:MAG: DNRLRE domain-containing protein [Candidatus Eisenbacteria bacterium]|nr:DNRLRE domain-containing protein [Candidatus Eisenbacteria bacterium]
MKGTTLALIATLVSATAFSAPRAETMTFEPSDDMYSDPNHSGTPPTETELWVANYSGVGHFERIMMRFDWDGAPAAIDSATLHLYRFFRCPSHFYTAVNFYGITEEWNEETWDHTTHIPHESTPFLTYTFGPDLGWYAIDVTDRVRDWIGGTSANCGFVIEGLDGEKWSKFYSKECGNPGMRPYLTVDYSCVGVEEGEAAPLFDLTVVNPFRDATIIRYILPEAGPVTLDIYDLRGRSVAHPVDGSAGAGSHVVVWDGRDDRGEEIPAGIYFCRLRAGNLEKTQKAIRLR